MTDDSNEVDLPLKAIARRGAISSTTSFESTDGMFNIEKDSRLVKLFNKAVENNLLFTHLDENERIQVFNVMSCRSYSPDEIIIDQNNEQEYFYIIEEGEVDVYADDQLIASFGEYSSFGELALIQNTSRFMTIKAKTNVKLWTLLGETYRKILMDITMNKRKVYDEFLIRVPILQTLNEVERFIIADSLESVQYEDGDIVVKQGELGDDFFLIVEGNCIVYQKACEYSEGVEIDTLGPGDYFGEIALLCNRARVATLVAQGVLRCVKINRERFERVLGPIREILQRNISRYNSIISLEQLHIIIDKEKEDC
ncbi:unnamed protein product [Adineta ricciae]|uniref:Cyclic nucleotide-binding domain-containing protein n=1 Tax=Adineta ricciae TaxID=249248 RepID=A0A813ZG17_ADIRI|nr:unnamed protein product [Adineta ricciae]CAF1242897.1 unnamed protein product [Adineta ricciae]